MALFEKVRLSPNRFFGKHHPFPMKISGFSSDFGMKPPFYETHPNGNLSTSEVWLDGEPSCRNTPYQWSLTCRRHHRNHCMVQCPQKAWLIGGSPQKKWWSAKVGPLNWGIILGCNIRKCHQFLGPLILRWRKIWKNHGLPGVEGIRHHSFDGHPESRSYMIIFVCPKCFKRNNLIFGITESMLSEFQVSC